jgi:hypothetical protein
MGLQRTGNENVDALQVEIHPGDMLFVRTDNRYEHTLGREDSRPDIVSSLCFYLLFK